MRSGCGSGTPYTGGTTTAADSAAKVRSAAPKRSPHRCGRPSASSSATKSSSRQTAASSSTSIPGRMPSACRTNRWASGHPSANRAVLPPRHALVVEAQHAFALGEHMDVHQPPPLRPELLVQALAEPLDLVTGIRLRGKQPLLGWRAGIDPGQDVCGVGEHSLGRHQHGNRAPAAGAPRGDPVDALDVALLAIGHSSPLEGPARLLAVVADRDRDEPQHRSGVSRAWRAQAV